MTKTKQQVKKQLKTVKRDSHANRMLRILRSTGLFRWERPSARGRGGKYPDPWDWYRYCDCGMRAVGCICVDKGRPMGDCINGDFWGNDDNVVFWFNHVSCDDWQKSECF